MKILPFFSKLVPLAGGEEFLNQIFIPDYQIEKWIKHGIFPGYDKHLSFY